jgi:hypothetical protein
VELSAIGGRTAEGNSVSITGPVWLWYGVKMRREYLQRGAARFARGCLAPMRERERSIFFRGYRYALRDQDTT